MVPWWTALRAAQMNTMLLILAPMRMIVLFLVPMKIKNLFLVPRKMTFLFLVPRKRMFLFLVPAKRAAQSALCLSCPTGLGILALDLFLHHGVPLPSLLTSQCPEPLNHPRSPTCPVNPMSLPILSKPQMMYKMMTCRNLLLATAMMIMVLVIMKLTTLMLQNFSVDCAKYPANHPTSSSATTCCTRSALPTSVRTRRTGARTSRRRGGTLTKPYHLLLPRAIV